MAKKWIITQPDQWEPCVCNNCPLFINRKCGPSEDCPLSTSTPYEEQEPLACLADRKHKMGSMKICERPSGWRIEFSTTIFTGNTYLEAESKARIFLEGLEDRKGDKQHA